MVVVKPTIEMKPKLRSSNCFRPIAFIAASSRSVVEFSSPDSLRNSAISIAALWIDSLVELRPVCGGLGIVVDAERRLRHFWVTSRPIRVFGRRKNRRLVLLPWTIWCMEVVGSWSNGCSRPSCLFPVDYLVLRDKEPSLSKLLHGESKHSLAFCFRVLGRGMDSSKTLTQ
jgi:hypothetical protein